jgi:hypothetical protein
MRREETVIGPARRQALSRLSELQEQARQTVLRLEQVESQKFDPRGFGGGKEARMAERAFLQRQAAAMERNNAILLNIDKNIAAQKEVVNSIPQ